MADRLRDLLDLVLDSLDEPGADGRELARRAHFSRDHLDRLLAAATGETPVALRRRLLLERAAWQLRRGGLAPSDVAQVAGYGSLAAFSRAFKAAYGVGPSAYAAAGDVPLQAPAPNGIHFHPPAGLLVPGGGDAAGAATGRDLTERMVANHLGRSRELLEIAAELPREQLERVVRPGLVLVWFEGPEETAALMAERLVATLEVWVAAMTGDEQPAGGGELLPRLERSGKVFARVARRVRDTGAWDDAFVDALCEPPEAFTYGSVLSHVLAYGALRRETLAGVLAELGADVPSGDPIMWERRTWR